MARCRHTRKWKQLNLKTLQVIQNDIFKYRMHSNTTFIERERESESERERVHSDLTFRFRAISVLKLDLNFYLELCNFL